MNIYLHIFPFGYIEKKKKLQNKKIPWKNYRFNCSLLESHEKKVFSFMNIAKEALVA